MMWTREQLIETARRIHKEYMQSYVDLSSADVNDAGRRASEAFKEEADQFEAIAAMLEAQDIARPFDEYHEDFGSVLWWQWPVMEPPQHIGSPNDSDWPFDESYEADLVWTPCVAPSRRGEA